MIIWVIYTIYIFSIFWNMIRTAFKTPIHARQYDEPNYKIEHFLFKKE